jgi:hypothetical protein
MKVRVILSIFFLVTIGACTKGPLLNTYYDKDAYGNVTQKSGLGIKAPKTQYPIDVFFVNERPKFPVKEIGPLEITDEVLIDLNKTTEKGRIVKQGNTYNFKLVLIDQLVQQAQDMGATVLYNLKYSSYISQTRSGYILSGTAGVYSAENTNEEVLIK